MTSPGIQPAGFGPHLGRFSAVVLASMVAIGCGSQDPAGTPDAGEVGVPDAGPPSEEAFKGNPTDDPAAPLFAWDSVKTYRVTLAPSDWDQMNANLLGSDLQEIWEQYYPATLEYDGMQVTDVAFRFKGGWGSLASCVYRMRDPVAADCDKFSFKLKFNEYDDTKRFFGLKRLNFNSMVNDKARMHEVLSYSLYRDQGVPASRATFANLVINGEDFGVFALVEAVDSEFLRARFNDHNGLLFKEIWPSNLDLSNADNLLSQALHTHRDEPHTFETIKAFVAAVQNVFDENYFDTLANWLELESFERYMVVDRLIENFDGVLAFYCFDGFGCINHNFYLYQEERTTRHWVIPWDLDLTFPTQPDPYFADYGVPTWTESRDCEWVSTTGEAALRPPGCDSILGGFVATRWDSYSAQVARSLGDDLSLDNINARIDEIADLLRPAIAADPKTHITPSGWESRVVTLKENAARLHLHLRQITEPESP